MHVNQWVMVCRISAGQKSVPDDGIRVSKWLSEYSGCTKSSVN